ncbi:MAG: ABC transporter permease [Candidatus Bipolaricaulota bacterium]
MKGSLPAKTSRNKLGSRRTRRFLVHWEVRLSLIVLCALCVAAALPTSLWDPAARQINLANRLRPPVLMSGSSGPLLGTDQLGRDMFSRLLVGIRLTLIIAGLATASATLFGTAAGLLAGYLGGAVDLIISRFVDMFLAFPVMLLVLVLAATLGRSPVTVALVLGFSGWARFTRVARSAVLTCARRDYVESARALGASSGRIMAVHVVPNIMTTILVMSTFNLAQFVLLESSVSFLGLGPPPPSVTWGGLAGMGREYLYNGWWLCFFPGLAISLLVLAVSVIGDALRDAYDPHTV